MQLVPQESPVTYSSLSEHVAHERLHIMLMVPSSVVGAYSLQ